MKGTCYYDWQMCILIYKYSCETITGNMSSYIQIEHQCRATAKCNVINVLEIWIE